MAKDSSAWVELYLLWTPRIYGFFRVELAGDPSSIDDLTQETMIGAWRTLEVLKKPPRKFDSWLFAIARYKLNNYIKERVANRERRALGLRVAPFRPEDFTTGALREAEMRADWAWFVDLLQDAIESMPVRYREVLRTHLATGATGADLAGLLGLSARDATKWRSDGHPKLYETVVVTMMARGRSGKPCRQFRKKLAEAGWHDGPLGEVLRGTLINHVGQCDRCQEHRKRLKKTLELLPVFITIIVPASVYAGIRENTDPNNKQRRPADPALVAMAKHEQSRIGNVVEDVVEFMGKIVLFGITLAVVNAVVPGGLGGIVDRLKGDTATGPPVGLNVWAPAGSYGMHIAPVGTTCVPVTALDSCQFSVRSGTQVTLTAQQPQTDPTGPFRWLGCPTGSDGAQPCTFVVSGTTAVCLVHYTSPWSLEDCREWAAG